MEHSQPSITYTSSDGSITVELDRTPDLRGWLPERERVIAIALLEYSLRRLRAIEYPVSEGGPSDANVRAPAG